MAIEKYSRQREAIIAELRSRTDHPTAEELYMSLKSTMPSLSLGTVYRNLNRLSEDAVIRKISLDGADRFDGTVENHYHFNCIKCGRVYDVAVPVIDEINRVALDFTDGKILTHSLIFEGVCNGCQ